ncbi:DNAase [Paenibacillus sp. IHBB 10380]|uniref:TatD family hydrolase n=1 Tax=Paenibacillus sp. IHBB 10380 TaxID=1566358 RepID=UPI0005CFC072|nr:TatD family hydrolase [Paenibacillus sp. IHBB 10380]AJS61717.1 DNAase [Paenibacillus sp. IHBB 10380]
MNNHNDQRIADDASLAPFIDAHIHLDTYTEEQQHALLTSLSPSIAAVIAVSMHQQSSQYNLKLAQKYPSLIHPAFGFHPEQPLPLEEEILQLFSFMEEHLKQMVAVGEVGLPYYSRLEAQEAGLSFNHAAYVTLLERFISFASIHKKPIILHAVYEDADIACNLLEQYNVTRAHFHWFKGSANTVERMIHNGYYISFTPDIVYEPEIQELARLYPKDQVMAETDGPWPFEGPFSGQMTHPEMVSTVIEKWSQLQGLPVSKARKLMYDNTRRFYKL